MSPRKHSTLGGRAGVFHGCHGVRVEPDGVGAGYGTTIGEPKATVRVSRTDDRPSLTGHEELLWSADVDLPEGGTQTHQMWRNRHGDLVLAIAGRAVLGVARHRDAAEIGDVNDGVALQLVTTFALPLAAQRCGAFVLHASVVVRDGVATVICAEAGSGKSSTLIALRDAGWSALTEDLVALDLVAGDRPIAWPGPPWVRVAPEQPGPSGGTQRFRTADKVAWDLQGRGRCEEPVPVGRLVLLDAPTDEPTMVRPAAPEEVMGALALHAPWFEEASTKGAALFGSAVQLARSVPATRLRLQRSDDWRVEAESILADLA